jgi:Fe-S cluster assembly protein SufD
VKCSHGAAAGELDEDALFYLRARGIGQADARRMLVEAFVGETLENISNVAVRAAFERRIGAWMSAAAEQPA